MIAVMLMLTLQGAPAPVMDESQACQLECGMMVSACIGDCAGGLDPELPESKPKVEACAKTCSAKAQPCMQQCKKGGKKP
jgi:hypothetical protein